MPNSLFQISGQRRRDEVDERGMDLGRIIHLLYGCSVHDDVEVPRRADESYLQLVSQMATKVALIRITGAL